MAIDPSIPLQTRTFDPSQGINQLVQATMVGQDRKEKKEDRAQQRELRNLQIAGATYELLGNREKRRLDSTITGAATLNSFLDSDDLDGAKAYLQARKNELVQQNKQFPQVEVDTVETDRALQLIESGDVDKLKATTRGLVKLGQMKGILPGGSEGGFTLSEGQTRFNAQGQPVAQSPKTDGTDAKDQRDRKIQDYMRLFGKSEEDATRVVDSSTMIDDKGNLITYDPIAGKGKLVDVNTGEESPVIQPPDGVSVEDLAFDPSKGTGFAASFIGLWNSTLGQLPLMPIGEDAEKAAQNLRVLERDAIRALASSGRPPVIEQQRIASLIPEAMSFGQNPEVAKFKMTNFIDLMMNQYVDDKRFMEERSNPKSVREDSGRRAKEIESIVRRVLTPDAADAMFQSLDKMESELGEIRDADLSTIDPSTLSDAQLDLYIERLRTSGK